MKITLDIEKSECASKIFLDLCEKWNLIFKIDTELNGLIKISVTHKNNNNFISNKCIEFNYFHNSINWENLVDTIITYKFTSDNDFIQKIMNGTF